MKHGLFMAASLLSLAMSLASCSEDDQKFGLSLPEGTENTITLDYTNTLKTIKLDADSHWNASVVYADEEDDGWIGLLDDNGEGSGEINFVVDANTSNDLRVAKIIIASGENKIEYTVNQNPVNADGENGELDMSKFGKSIPLGFGMKVAKGRASSGMTMGQVLVLDSYKENSTFKKYAEELNLNPAGYVDETRTTEVETQMLYESNCESNSRNITANLEVNVAYGLFKLGLNGSFKMFGSSTDTTFNYSVAANRKVGKYSVNLGKVMDDYDFLTTPNEDDDKGIEQMKRAAQKMLLSSSFIKIRDEIETLVSQKDANKLQKKLDELNKKFGPAYITQANVGGSIELNYIFKEENGTDTLNIHGDLHFGLNALLSLNVSAEAQYMNGMNTHIQSSIFQSRVKGGTIKAASDVNKKFAGLISKKGEETVSFEKMISSIDGWYESVKADTVETITCTDYYPAPIWELFSEDAEDVLKEYFKKKYPNNEDGSCPYTFDIQEMVEHW